MTTRRPSPSRLAAVGAAVATAALLAAGCGGDEATGAEAPATTGESEVQSADATLTVQQAVDDAPSGKVTVRGWVVPVGGDLRLCTTRADTEPPGCGDPSILLSGYAGTISALEEVDVVGTIENGLLVFDPQSLLDLGNAG